MTRPLFALAIALALVGSLVTPVAAAPEDEGEAGALLPVAQLELLRVALERALLLREEHALARRHVLEREGAARVALRLGELRPRETPEAVLGRGDLGLGDRRALLVAHGAAQRRALEHVEDPRWREHLNHVVAEESRLLREAFAQALAVARLIVPTHLPAGQSVAAIAAELAVGV